MIRKLFSLKRIVLYASVILVTYIFTSAYMPFYSKVGAVTYKYGSRGQMVTTIQTKLKNWDYYDGPIDGVFGSKTVDAIKYFQRKNGLTPDGIVGRDTLSSLGINVSASNSSSSTEYSKDVMLLARLINGEARGEPYEGQVAVGAVVINRTKDPAFPSTIAGVIYQPGAFTAIVDGQIDAKLEQSSINAARDALNGWDPSQGAIYYFNPAKTTNAWIWSRPLIKVIGRHRFCR